MFVKLTGKSLAALLLLPSFMFATDLRGRIARVDPYQGTIPAAGVRLTLQNQSGQVINKVISRSDGFYYLYNIAPGSYRLLYEYVDKGTSKPMSGMIPLAVKGARTQDIIQITLRN